MNRRRSYESCMNRYGGCSCSEKYRFIKNEDDYVYLHELSLIVFPEAVCVHMYYVRGDAFRISFFPPSRVTGYSDFTCFVDTECQASLFLRKIIHSLWYCRKHGWMVLDW